MWGSQAGSHKPLIPVVPLWAGGCSVPTQTLADRWINWGGVGVLQESLNHFSKTVVFVEELGDLNDVLRLLPTCRVTLGISCSPSEPGFPICLMLRAGCPIEIS